MRTIGYLGPRGTFSEQATLNYLGDSEAKLVPCSSLPEVCLGVDRGDYDEGVLPLENLIEGGVNPVLDLLLELPQLKIQAEVMLPVQHHLLVRPESTSNDISTIISHSQPLAQCRNYLAQKYPGARLMEVESTAQAAQMVAMGGRELAAISPISAASNHKLKILAQNIQDQPHNCTRFVVVGRGELPSRDVPYKTSLMISVIDRPGALYSILKEFAWRGINLTRIESRPAKTYLGEYIFFIDLEGHRHQPEITEALKNVTGQSKKIRILGCYPAWVKDNFLEHKQQEDNLEQLRTDIDIIDRQVIELLGKRAKLVNRIGEVKQSSCQVRDLDREAKVLAKVRRMAAHYGLAPEVMESVYQTLMDYFVEVQIKQLTSQDQ